MELDEHTQTNYRIWKKNTPFLYDYLSTNSLLWPSMTVQFFPDLNTNSKSNELSQRILLGTFTSSQATDSISILQFPYYKNLNEQLNIDKLNYNPDKKEFELSTVTKKKLSVLQKINHYGDVNKAVYMPQNPDVIASGNNHGSLIIYDRTKHSSYKNAIDSDDINKPELSLNSTSKGENEDIFAIDWNQQLEGVIALGKMNGVISIHDIKQINKQSTEISPIWIVDNGNDGVNDVQWIPHHDSILMSVDEAGVFRIHDIRVKETTVTRKVGDNAINSLSIHPENLINVLLGDDKGNTLVWDVRNLKFNGDCIHNFKSESEEPITRVKWHPKLGNIFGTASVDKTVKLYDVTKYDRFNEGLLFIHGGHMLGVNDFSWSLHDDWMMSSVSNDNSLHIWKPHHQIIAEYI